MSNEEMDLMLDFDTSEAVEMEPVEGGEEYELRLVKIMRGETKAKAGKPGGEPYLLFTFEIMGEPTAPYVTYYCAITTPEMREQDPRRANLNLLKFKRLEQCFGFSLQGASEQDIIGSTGHAILGVQGDEDDEYGIQNNITKLLPRA